MKLGSAILTFDILSFFLAPPTVHLVSQKTMRSIKGHIKKRPGKNKNWKRAKIAIQLQKALMSMKQKQMGLEEELSHGYE